MAIFKSLIKVLKPNKTHFSNPSKRTFLTFSNAYIHPIIQTTPFPIRQHFLFRPRFHFFLPFKVGPLFLSNPPWKLSQSSTPLLLQSDKVLSFIKARALNLIEKQDFRENVFYEDRKRVVCVEELGNVGVALRESYFNVPNLISFARMASGSVIGWMIIHDMYSSAFVCLAISGASDWLDGYVARKMRINSVVGSYLDPLADKVLIGCVALAMVEKGLLHPGLVGLVLARDIALVGGAVYKRASNLEWRWDSWRDFFNLDEAHVQKIEPLMISKVNTVFQLALVAAALLQPGFGSEETQLYIDYLSWLVVSTTVASTAAYGAQHLKSKAAMIKSSKFKH